LGIRRIPAEAVLTGYGMAYDVSYGKNDMIDKVVVLKMEK
jgi:hypothetical protein